MPEADCVRMCHDFYLYDPEETLLRVFSKVTD